MPELPDVEGFKQYLEKTALGRRIREASVADRRILRKGLTPGKFSSALKGQQLREARRHGKLLFVQFDADAALAMHFGMTGELSYYAAEDERPRYARVILTLDNDLELAYCNRRMLGWVGVTDDIDQFVAEEKLGPDALDDQLDARAFQERLRNRRTAIKAMLMNQQVMAGIGSVWADEILFQARLHPQTRLPDVDDRGLRELHRVMRRVLGTGARHGGDNRKLPSGYLLPHREEGECPRCHDRVEKIRISGRPTYYCPRCQKQRQAERSDGPAAA